MHWQLVSAHLHWWVVSVCPFLLTVKVCVLILVLSVHCLCAVAIHVFPFVVQCSPSHESLVGAMMLLAKHYHRHKEDQWSRGRKQVSIWTQEVYTFVIKVMGLPLVCQLNAIQACKLRFKDNREDSWNVFPHHFWTRPHQTTPHALFRRFVKSFHTLQRTFTQMLRDKGLFPNFDV